MSPPLIAPILPTSSTLPYDTPTLSSLEIAASILKSEGLVAFPTETVYGLGASALSTSAVLSIYKAKGRPSDNPLIVHISSLEMLYELIPGGENGLPKIYLPLLKKFWPGPLSLIFPLLDRINTSSLPLLEQVNLDSPNWKVSPVVTAGLPSLAIRMPSHPLALSLIQLSNLPLAAPSANLSSRPSPTTALHVSEDLGNERGLGAILDGGECTVGVESTVIDFVLSDEEKVNGGIGKIRVLRAGGVSAEELEECLREAGFSRNGGEKVQVYQRDFKSTELEAKPTTPGMKYKHYSPTNCKVILVRSSSDAKSTRSLLELIQQEAQALQQDNHHTTGQNSTIRIGLMLTSETLALCHPTSSSFLTPSTQHITLASPTTTAANGSPSITMPQLEIISYSLGSQSTPIESAQRLFAGLRYFDSLPPSSFSSTSPSTKENPSAIISSPVSTSAEDSVLQKKGVDIILVESIEEKGVGLAVVERARKAAGSSRNGEELLFGV